MATRSLMQAADIQSAAAALSFKAASQIFIRGDGISATGPLLQ
jgi:hypothetical protein